MSSGSCIAIDIVICVGDCGCDCMVGRGGKGGVSKLLAVGVGTRWLPVRRCGSVWVRQWGGRP